MVLMAMLSDALYFPFGFVAAMTCTAQPPSSSQRTCVSPKLESERGHTKSSAARQMKDLGPTQSTDRIEWPPSLPGFVP